MLAPHTVAGDLANMTAVHTNANAILLERWLDEGWNQGTPDAVDQLITDGWIRHDLAGPGLTNREEFKRSIRSIRTAFPDLHFTIQDVFANGDRVAPPLEFCRYTPGTIHGLGTHWPSRDRERNDF